MPIAATAKPATRRSERAASTIAPPGTQPHDPADRQHKTDLALRPFLGGQVDRDEGAKSGLHIGEEKDEPVETAQALGRRPFLQSIFPGRSRIAIGATRP